MSQLQCTHRPVLFVDVDGVISLFGFDPAGRPAGRFITVDGIAHFISAAAGDHLRRLSASFELVWCTGWEERANEYLPLELGLPAPLPYLRFAAPARGGRHWKLDAIERCAGDRPLAWIDDDHGPGCVEWGRRRAAPTLLVTTAPAVGLGDAEASRLQRWAGGLGVGAHDRGSIG